MGATWDTTQRYEDSVESTQCARLWLRWVYPTGDAAIPLEHGLVIGRDAECGARIGDEHGKYSDV